MNDYTPASRYLWAVVGDFNQLLRCSQHSGHPHTNVDASGIEDINLALQDAELFEVQTKGLPFSWWNNQDSNLIAKKIDHAFINQYWSAAFPDAFAEFLEPLQSDHAPCLFRIPSLKRTITKPFKFYHHTADHPQFKEIVAEAWNAAEVRGSCQLKVAKAMKGLKPALRKLNKRHFSGISERVKEQEKKVSELQRLLLTSPSEMTALEEHEARSKWHMLLKAEEKFYRQRSRVQWLELGDRNTSFFHKTVAQRLTRNHIHFLRDFDDRLIGSAEEIKAHSVNYFQNILGSTNLPTSPASVSQLQEILPFRCSEVHRNALQMEVSEEEITKTVFAMPLNKSPGPDGYSIEFIRASWATVGSDVISAVKEFFRNGRLLKDLNNTAICLIPKSSEACKLKDYRPISCCNIVYKVISKIIANRLKPILQECISSNQAAFLKGRSLGENVLLASELIRNYQKPSSPKSCMLKVDIRKAFDTICWDFVIKVLEAQGFPPLFCIWVKECVTSPRFSISINGELAGFFPGRKGLRQGDSISPYLFIMVMEVLSRLLEKFVAEERMRLHPMCSNPQVTHLLFADDLLIFSDGSRHSLSVIKTTLGVFREMCGLDINAEKTDIFFEGYNDMEISVLSALSGFKIGVFPTRYLGLPLDSLRSPMLRSNLLWNVLRLKFMSGQQSFCLSQGRLGSYHRSYMVW